MLTAHKQLKPGWPPREGKGWEIIDDALEVVATVGPAERQKQS